MGRVIGGLAFFALTVLALDGFRQALGIPVPTPILAMALLAFFFLRHGKVPDFIEDAANTLFRIFPLLFIPALVSIITLTSLVKDHWLVLLLVVTLSSLIGLTGAALTYKAMRRSR